MKVAGLICDETIAKDVLEFFNDNYTESSVLSTILTMAPKFSDTMIFCKLFDEFWSNCNKLLYPTITEEGLCYKFNSINMKEMLTDQ